MLSRSETDDFSLMKIRSDTPFTQIHHLHFEDYKDLGSPPYVIDTRYMANIDIGLLITTYLDRDWLSLRGWGDYATLYKSGIAARLCVWDEAKLAHFSLFGPKIKLSSGPSQRFEKRPRQAYKHQNLVWPPIGIEQAVVLEQLANLTPQTQSIDVQQWLVDVSSNAPRTALEAPGKDTGSRGRNTPSTRTSNTARTISHVENDQPIPMEGFSMQKSLSGLPQRRSPWTAQHLQRPNVQPIVKTGPNAHASTTDINVVDGDDSDAETDLIAFSDDGDSTPHGSPATRCSNLPGGSASMGKHVGEENTREGNALQKRVVDLLSDHTMDEANEQQTDSVSGTAVTREEIDQHDGTVSIARLPKALRELLDNGNQAKTQEPGIGDTANKVTGDLKEAKSGPKGKGARKKVEAFRIPLRVKTSLSKLLATGPYLRGAVSLTFDFGRIVLRKMDETALAFNNVHQRSNGWKDRRLEDALNAWFEKPDSMHFSKILTTAGSDIERVLKLEDNGTRLWDSSVLSKWRVYSFVLERLDGSDLYIDIEDHGVEDQQRVVIRETENANNMIWVHDVLRNWDGRFHLRHSNTEELQAKYGHIATTIHNSFYVTCSACGTLTMGFALPNDVTIPLRAFRSLCKWQATSSDDKTVLTITETQRAVWKPDPTKNGTASGWQHFVCQPEQEGNDKSQELAWPRMYYGMSITSLPLERLMDQNSTIPAIGGKACWSFENGQTAVYVNDIWAQASRMLQRMDQIGAGNNNGQLEKYKHQLPRGNSTNKVDPRDPLYGGHPGTTEHEGPARRSVWERQYW